MIKNKGGLSAATALALLATGAPAFFQAANAQTTIPREAAPAVTVSANSHSIPFFPFEDPWAPGKERFYDISNHTERRFDAFWDGSQYFRYDSAYNPDTTQAKVTLTYDQAPAVPYFVGRITATGLKPNFAYQLKLVGKPTKGLRGWRENGDDIGNERLGYVGRWWCDSYHATQTNFDDSHYLNFYKNAPANGNPVHDIYGYLYAGAFITDKFGNATVDFTGKNSYHITWAQWQTTSLKHVEHHQSPFQIEGNLLSSTPTNYYAYGSAAPTTSVRLYYEYEGNGRPRNNVQLAPGTYKARFVLTEESFHNSSGNPEGGYWKTVLGTEDYSRDINNNLIPDSDPNNDITFTITAPPAAPSAPGTLAAEAASRSQINLTWADNSGDESGFKIERSTSATTGWAQIAQLGADVTSFANTGLKGNTTYYYRVRAFNSVGNSAYSNTASARTPR